MTKNEVIEQAKKSDKLELLLFKTHKKTKKKYLMNHSCKTVEQLEKLLQQLNIGEREYYYNLEIA
jgi:hypothetical protein